MGIELKRFDYGMDPWADLPVLFRKKPAKIVFDVGANCGQTSIQLSKLFPNANLWAFEPNPNIFPQLKQNTAPLKQVTALPMALGNRQTNMTLHITGSHLNTSLLNYTREDGTDRVVENVEVPVDTLDHFCQQHHIDSIDLLKTDVQGYDKQVLEGARELFEKNRVHAVFCEINIHKIYEDQCTFEEVYSYLTQFGFRLSGLYDLIREESFHIHWFDALFIRPEHFPKRI